MTKLVVVDHIQNADLNILLRISFIFIAVRRDYLETYRGCSIINALSRVRASLENVSGENLSKAHQRLPLRGQLT